MKKKIVENRQWIFLAVITTLGAALRLPGIKEGLIHIFQPDEGKLVGRAIEMARELHFWNNDFTYPNQFISKPVAVLIYLYGEIIQGSLNNYTMTQGYFIFRGVTAVFSTMTIIAAYFIGEKLKKQTGLILAGFTAFFPQFIIMARQVTGDTTAFFFMSLVLLCSLTYIEKRQYKYLACMSIFAAMATLEKWHSAVACFYIGIVILFTCKNIKKFLLEGVMSFFVYIATMYVIAPNMVLQPGKALEGILHMRNDYGDTAITLAIYQEHIKVYCNVVGQYGGAVLKILFLIGGIFILKNLSKKYLVLCMGMFKLFITAFLNRAFPRWALEFYFMVGIVATMGVYWVLHWRESIQLENRKKEMIGRKILVVILAGFLMARFLSVDLLALAVTTHSENDTRMVQVNYCDENMISEENSVWDNYTGFAPGGMTWHASGGKHNRDESFIIVDDNLYKTKQADYAIINVTRYNDETVQLLSEKCPVIMDFRAVCGDNFMSFQLYDSGTENEITYIMNRFRCMRQIYKRQCYTGYRIVIYDIRGIEFKEKDV